MSIWKNKMNNAQKSGHPFDGQKKEFMDIVTTKTIRSYISVKGITEGAAA